MKVKFAALLLVGMMVGSVFGGFIASAADPDPSEKHNLIPPLSSKLNTLYFHERWDDSAASGVVTLAGQWMNTVKGGKDPDHKVSAGGTAIIGPAGTETTNIYDLDPIGKGTLVLDTAKEIEATIVLGTDTGFDPTSAGCKVTVTLKAGSTEIGSASQSQVTIPSGATYVLKFKPSVGTVELSESNNLVCEIKKSQTVMPTGSTSAPIEQWKIVLPIIDGPGDHIVPIGNNNIAFAADSDTQEGNPGSSVVFTITATNAGAAAKVSPTAVSSSQNWTATVSPAEIEIGANGNATFTVTVAIPSDAKIGDTVNIDIFGAKDKLTLAVKASGGETPKGKTPGFELLGLLGAIGVAAVLLRRKK
jgi:hypothetical protein